MPSRRRKEAHRGEETRARTRPGGAQAKRSRSAPGRGQADPRDAKHLELSEQTYHRWRKQYGGLKANDAKRLKELSNENIRLKRIVADKELEIDALREVAKGNF